MKPTNLYNHTLIKKEKQAKVIIMKNMIFFVNWYSLLTELWILIRVLRPELYLTPSSNIYNKMRQSHRELTSLPQKDHVPVKIAHNK
jgi:hypothetical protein